MKRVMLVSALALGLAGGLCAAPTLQTLTVNDDGKGDRQVLGIFGNYQNISVKEAESGATTITFSVRTENLELSESTTITVAPKTDGGYTVTLGEGAPQEATEVWLFAGTYRGQNQSDSAWRSLYISGGHLERVFGGGYEETQKEVPTSALGLPVNLTVAGGTFGSVAGGSYNGGPIMETMVTGGDIDVLAANGMADADLTEEEIAKMPTPGTARLTMADRAGSSSKAYDATVGIVYGGGCGGPVKTSSTVIELSAGTVGDVYLSGKEDSALSSTIGFTLGGATVTGTVRLFSPDLKAQSVNSVDFQLGEPDLVGDARIVLNGVAACRGNITVSRTGADEALDVYVEESLWRTDCYVSLSGGATATATAYRLVADGDDATFTVPEGVSLNVGKGTSLVIPAGMTVDNKGTVTLASGATAQFQGVLDEAALATAQAAFSGVAGATLTANGVTYGWGDAGWGAQPVAQVGGQSYESLAAAFEAAASGQTISLLTDVALTAPITIPAGKKLTLALAGKTITASDLDGAAFVNAGTLTVSGAEVSKIVATGTVFANSGTLNIGTKQATVVTWDVTVQSQSAPAITNTGTLGVLAGAKVFTTEGLVGGNPVYAVVSGGNDASVEFGQGNNTTEGAPVVRGAYGAVLVTGGKIMAYVSDLSAVGCATHPGEAVGPAVRLAATDATITATFGATTLASVGADALVIDGVAGKKSTVSVLAGTYQAAAGGAALRVNGQRDEVDLKVEKGTFKGEVAVEAGEDPLQGFITEGIFATVPDAVLFASEGLSSFQTSDGLYVVGDYEARIDDTPYASFVEAFNTTKTGTARLTLLKDITLSQTLELNKRSHDVSLDLNDHDIAFATDRYFDLRQGRLTLSGEGTVSTVSEQGFAPIAVRSVTDEALEWHRAILKVGEGVTLEGPCGINVAPYNDETSASGVEIEVAGKIVAEQFGINLNGVYQETEDDIGDKVPTITVTETADIASVRVGIYAAGYAKWNLAGKVTARTALVVRSGDLTFTDGTYASTMPDAFEEVPTDMLGGAVGTGAAISVSTAASGYADTTRIDIQGGTFTSANGPAIYEYASPTASAPAKESQVVLAISDGTFTSHQDYAPLLLTAIQDSHVVSGGTFCAPVDLAFCAPGYIPVAKEEEGSYGVAGGDYVAVVETTAGNYVGYATLQTAFDAAEAGQTVALLADQDLSGQGLTVRKSVTFDLNGHTLALANSDSGNLDVSGGATLTLKDGADTTGSGAGKIVATHDYASGYGTGLIYVNAGADFVMEGGLIDAVREDPVNKGQFGVMVAETGSATINGGHIRAGWYAIAGNGNDKVAPGTTIVVNGGILESTADYAIYHPQAGTLTIAGGTVAGAAGGLSINRGTAIITGGTVTSAGTGDTGEWPDGTSGQGNAAITVGAKYDDVALTISGDAVITAPEGVPALSVPDSAHAQALAISGGTFSTKPDNAYFAPGYIPVANEDGTFGVAEGEFAARIGAEKFLTLAEAIAAVPANGAEATTITLLSDVVSAGSLTLTNGQKAVLGMNGKSVTFTAGKLQLRTSASLTLTGEGALVCEAPSTGAISLYGNENSQLELLIDADVTVEGHYGIALFGSGSTACRNTTVTIKGAIKTSEGGSGIYTNGTMNDMEGPVPHIILAEGATVDAVSVGIQASGYATWDLAGAITAAHAVCIKSGVFNITGGTYTSTGAFKDPADANSNGTEETGAAVTITTNPSYAPKTEVNITGGTFVSANGYAVYEGIAVKDGQPIASASTAVIEISNGTFTGSAAITADVAITTAADKRVISGGVFSKPVPEALCAYGYDPVDNGNGTYGVVQDQTKHSVVIRADGTTVECDSMEDAYVAFYADGNTAGTIRLLTDMESGSPINLNSAPDGTGAEMVFDLDGHTMTFKGYAFNVERTANVPPVSLTFADSSEAQTGKVIGTADRIGRMSGGLLTIAGGCFIHNPAKGVTANEAFLVTEGFTVAPAPDCSVAFQGSTILVEPSGNEALQALGVQIKGGTFTSASGKDAIVLSKDGYASGYWHYDSPIGNVVVSGGTFEGEGQAFLIENPTTVTVAGGDFTEATLNIADVNATLKVAGGVFEKTAFVGTGTLDVAATVGDLSMATLGALEGKLTLAGDLDIGTNRPTGATVAATAPATVTVDASADELTCGKVPVFAAGDSVEAPANLSLTVGNLLETQTLAAAETRVEEGKVLLAFTAVPTAFADSAALVAYLQGAGLGSVVALSGTTQGGKTELTAAQMVDALAVFQPSADLLAQESAEGGFALSLAYDFGITSVTVAAEGMLTVVAQAQCANGKALAFAEGVSLTLVDAESQALIADTAQVEGGTVTFSGVALPEGAAALRLQVRVSGPAASDGKE